MLYDLEAEDLHESHLTNNKNDDAIVSILVSRIITIIVSIDFF